MQAVAAIRAVSAENDFDGAICPKCAMPVGEPKSSDYRGLGRIEHSWHCGGCGDRFRTMSRMAGAIEFESDAASVAAA